MLFTRRAAPRAKLPPIRAARAGQLRRFQARLVAVATAVPATFLASPLTAPELMLLLLIQLYACKVWVLQIENTLPAST